MPRCPDSNQGSGHPIFPYISRTYDIKCPDAQTFWCVYIMYIIKNIFLRVGKILPSEHLNEF